MKKTDIGVVAFMYAVCLGFLTMTLRLKPRTQTYPLFIIIVLAVLTTLYLIQMIIRARKFGVTSGLEDFKDMLPRQFFTVLAMIICYLAVMPFAGFWLSTAVFMLSCLFFLKVRLWQSLLSTAAVVGMVYCAFTLFLRVRLPAGIIFR